jgi:DNA-directed RNA polymerase beta subunit
MKITLNILVDPITQEVLENQGIPSNILDLLLYANTLLGDNSFRQLGDILNYRLRNYEQIAGMLNQILIKSYIDYLNGYLRGNTRNTFDVSENAVIFNLLKISSVNTYSALSPVLELETYSRTSQKGFMGLEKAASFSQATREFNNNKLSVYAAGATAFGGSSGITRSLTYQPHISGIRGYISEITDIENTPDTRMLSASELLSPFLSRHADASRQSMAIGQFKHNMPLNKGSVRLWSSGAEEVVPGLLSRDFIFKAKKDGSIKKYDVENDIVEIVYTDGTTDFIDLSTSFIRNSANAFYTPNKLIMRFKEKDRFKKDDIIAYNDSFFKSKDNGEVELLVGTLAKVAIAPIDNSFEDSTIITKKLSNKGTSRVVIPEMVRLTPTSKIKRMSQIGDHVDETTAVIEYDDYGDNDFDTILGDSLEDKYGNYEILPSSTKYPNYHGVIKEIEVFYNVDKQDLNESLVKLINEFGGKYDKKLKFVGENNSHLIKQKRPEKQSINMKEDGESYEGLMIKFYIQSNVTLGIGDKLSYDTALKGVISNVLDDEQAPYSEFRPEEEIESILTPTGVFSRMTHDIFYLLFTNKLLVELGKKIGEIRDEE